MTSPPSPAGQGGPRRDRRWRSVLVVVIAVGGVVVLAVVARTTLSQSFTTLGRLRWKWIPLAVYCEFGSMAAVARSQRRLLRTGGTKTLVGTQCVRLPSAPVQGEHEGRPASFSQRLLDNRRLCVGDDLVVLAGLQACMEQLVTGNVANLL